MFIYSFIYLFILYIICSTRNLGTDYIALFSLGHVSTEHL